MSLEHAALSITIGLSSIVLFVIVVSFVIIPVANKLLNRLEKKETDEQENVSQARSFLNPSKRQPDKLSGCVSK